MSVKAVKVGPTSKASMLQEEKKNHQNVIYPRPSLMMVRWQMIGEMICL